MTTTQCHCHHHTVNAALCNTGCHLPGVDTLWRLEFASTQCERANCLAHRTPSHGFRQTWDFNKFSSFVWNPEANESCSHLWISWFTELSSSVSVSEISNYPRFLLQITFTSAQCEIHFGYLFVKNGLAHSVQPSSARVPELREGDRCTNGTTVMGYERFWSNCHDLWTLKQTVVHLKSAATVSSFPRISDAFHASSIE